MNTELNLDPNGASLMVMILVIANGFVCASFLSRVESFLFRMALLSPTFYSMLCMVLMLRGKYHATWYDVAHDISVCCMYWAVTKMVKRGAD